MSLEKKLNIFDYIKKYNLEIPDKKIFNELWSYFKNQDELLISDTLLEFMGFIIDLTTCKLKDKTEFKNNYIKFLKEHNIDFEEINYLSQKSKKYEEISHYIFFANPESLQFKKWLILSFNNFKESIMMLNKKEIKKKYFQIEKIFYDYKNYLKDYEFCLKESNYIEQIEKQKNVIEDLELEKKKQKILNLKKEEIIYISTTKLYESQNLFKIGGLKKFNLLNHILIKYNARIIEENNKMYYVFITQVNNYKIFKEIFWSIVIDFKDKKNKDFINMDYFDLENIFTFIKENYNKNIDYFNTNKEMFLKNAKKNNNQVNLTKIDLNYINTKNVLNIENISELEKEIENYFIKNIEENNLILKKKDINNYLSSKYKINKNKTWLLIKSIKVKYNCLTILYK